MVEYVYKFKSDPTIAGSRIKPKSIVDKPDSKADEPSFMDTFYDSLSSFFSSEEDAKRALSPKEEGSKAGEKDIYDAYESAMENRRMREAMGITQSLVEGGGEAYRKEPPEGTITRPVARPDELVTDTAKDVEESAPVTAETDGVDAAVAESLEEETATQGNGLMSPGAEVAERYTVTDSSLEDLYAPKGPAYRDSEVVSHSYYKTPIVDRFKKGNSRIGGDAPKEVQKAAIEAIITQGVRAGLSKDEIALTLAIAKHESGFNPDAAAGTTSAHGLGQFVNKTGKAYGLVDNNRWQISAQARALVKHTKDNIALAKSRGKGTEYVYKYHHDGPTKDYGGLATSKDKVMPLVSSFSKLLDGLDIPDKAAPEQKPIVEKELAPKISLRPQARK